MAFIQQFQSDDEKMQKGAWVAFGDPSDPIVFRILPFMPSYKRYLANLDPAERQLAREGRLSSVRSLEIAQHAIAECVIQEWQNMQDLVDGEVVDVPYSKEKALEILRNPRYEELHEFLVEQARGKEAFRRTFLLESAKNSDGDSAGT